MGHKKPLWEGVDSEFLRWAHETFGIPTTIQQITITPRVASRRAAVAIGGNDGAIVFMLISHNDRKQLEIRPHLMGPIYNNATILANAKSAATDGEISKAITKLVTRHLTQDDALHLMLHEVH
jgi:hypothetical protein